MNRQWLHLLTALFVGLVIGFLVGRSVGEQEGIEKFLEGSRKNCEAIGKTYPCGSGFPGTNEAPKQ